MLMNKACKTLLAAALVALPGLAMANDYATTTRVHYVQECIHANSEMNIYEGTYKCSCVIDQIAEKFDENKFQELNAGYTFRNMVADRGRTVRGSPNLSEELVEFQDTLLAAYQQCKLKID
jgi:hypothetical protein